MPDENQEHEGTWLQWPHQYTYGTTYRNRLDQTWVDMTKNLVESEKVHIVAYNNSEKNRIINLLNTESVSMTNIDFYIHPTDDVWVRDNGPMFVYDNAGTLKMLDWGFNGWGNDTPFILDNAIPQLLSPEIGIERINLNAMVLEGGAAEIDGNGTIIATKSSVTDVSRNPGFTQTQIENYMTINMGISNFIWLEGLVNTDGTEITDMHIDGFVKFANTTTMLTLSDADLTYWGLIPADITAIHFAKNKNDIPYTLVTIPLTQNDVTTAYGYNLGYKGSYANYYVGNTVVLVPNYNDPNDAVANAIIQGYYPGRTVVGIDVRNLYENGGMVHCVTQQQPVSNLVSGIKSLKMNIDQIYPNPFNEKIAVDLNVIEGNIIEINLFNAVGQLVYSQSKGGLKAGFNSIEIDTRLLEKGVYMLGVSSGNQQSVLQKVVLMK